MKKSQLKEMIREIIQETLQHESQASDDAKKQGLEYMSFGRWGKDGKITHTTQSGKLVPVRDPKTGQADRKLLSPPRVHKSPEAQRQKNQPKDDLGYKKHDRTPYDRATRFIANKVLSQFDYEEEIPKDEFMKKTGLTQQQMDTWASIEDKNSGGDWYIPMFSDYGDRVRINNPLEL